MQFAFDEYENLISIQEYINKKASYFCPHCKEEVIARKGSIRQPHFAHKADSNCSASEETILHFEAKHYIAAQLSSKESEISFDIPLSGYIPALSTLSKELGIKNSTVISLKEIAKFYNINDAVVEKMIQGGLFIADVLGTDVKGYKQLVIEIFVNHENEIEKREFLQQNQIPYLELSPYYNQNGQLAFNLHDFHLPGMLEVYKEKFDKVIVNYLFPLYEDELMKKAERVWLEVEILQHKLSAVQALKKQIGADSFYSELLNTMDANSKTTKVILDLATEKGKAALKDLEIIRKFKNGKYEYYLKGRTNKGEFWIAREQTLFRDMIYQLLSQVNISALLGGWENSQNESIIGFELNMPEPSKLNETVRAAVDAKLSEFEVTFIKKIDSMKKSLEI